MNKHAANAEAASEATVPKSLTVALVGNPNTGKSTLFSALCGVPTRIGNYPGVTVEEKLGKYVDQQGEVTIVDLPGTYSLSARTPDEMVSVDVLVGRRREVPRVDAVVVIVDATNLERNLYLFSQVLQIGLPTVLVLNMWDRVASSGWKIEIQRLEARLGIDCIAVSAAKGIGIDKVKTAIRRAATRGASGTRAPFRPLPEAFYSECDSLRDWLIEQGAGAVQPFLVERMLIDVGAACPELPAKPSLQTLLAERIDEARQRLANVGCRVPTVETKSRYAWVRELLSGIVERPPFENQTESDRIDRIMTHRVWGLVFFAMIMFGIFQAIYSGATVLMDGIETGQQWVIATIQSLMPSGILRSLLSDGIVAGVGSVIVFLPQILLLFMFIGVLEDCGYMARAAFVMDRAMTHLGLSGKSFLPLMSSYACAVPGIMATRTIENWRDRLVTILIAPLMSCSARLPVYLLLIYAFVPNISWAGGWINLRGLILMIMHLIGLGVAIPIAWVLKKYVFGGQPAPFVLELPSYKWPSIGVVFYRVLERGQAFLGRAGILIFSTSVLVWAAGYFPSDHSQLHSVTNEIESIESSLLADQPESARLTELRSMQRQLNSQLIEASFLGRAGTWIEPIVKPLGWDWKIGVGVIASFPAREVIIATLGTIYSLGGEAEENSGLEQALRDAKWPDGSPVYTLPVAFSLMVFFALCAQCAATLMVIRHETNSWRWPIVTFVYMTTLAYVGALLTYQIGSRLFG